MDLLLNHLHISFVLFYTFRCSPIAAIQRRITLTNLSAIVNPDYGNVTFTMENSLINVTTFNSRVIQHPYLYFELNVNTKEITGYTNFVKKHLDVCEFLRNPLLEPLVNIAYSSVIADKNNHVYHSCPIPSVKFVYIFQCLSELKCLCCVCIF